MTRTTTRRARRTSKLLAVPVVAAVAVAGAACSPIVTSRPYSPSDGVTVFVSEEIRGLNVAVISAGEGEPGTLLGAFANDSDQDVEIEVAPEGQAGVDIPVDAGETVYLATTDGFDAQLASIDVPPGAVLPITVSSSDGSETSLSVPVLDGTLPEYEPLLP